MLVIRVSGSVAPKRNESEGKPPSAKESSACPTPVRLWAQPWGWGHLSPCRSRPCPQGHVKTCPSALCSPLQALRSCHGFGEEITAAPCASLSLSRAAPGGCFGGHMWGSLLRCRCSPTPAAHGGGTRAGGGSSSFQVTPGISAPAAPHLHSPRLPRALPSARDR